MKAEEVCGIPSYLDQRGKIEWIPDESAAGKGYYVARLLSSSTGAFNTNFLSLKQAPKKWGYKKVSEARVFLYCIYLI